MTNTEIVKGMYEAFNRGDTTPVLNSLSDNVEWIVPGGNSIPFAGPARIYYRDTGAGAPLVFLHGGWGYEVYPFDRQIAALSGKFRILIPDRSGYGRSSPIASLPADFHSRAVVETQRFLDALHI